MSPVVMYGPFCVQAGQTIEFAAQLTLDFDVEEVYLEIMMDNEVLARSIAKDEQEPSSQSLIYRGTVVDDAEF